MRHIAIVWDEQKLVIQETDTFADAEAIVGLITRHDPENMAWQIVEVGKVEVHVR